MIFPLPLPVFWKKKKILTATLKEQTRSVRTHREEESRVETNCEKKRVVVVLRVV